MIVKRDLSLKVLIMKHVVIIEKNVLDLATQRRVLDPLYRVHVLKLSSLLVFRLDELVGLFLDLGSLLKLSASGLFCFLLFGLAGVKLFQIFEDVKFRLFFFVNVRGELSFSLGQVKSGIVDIGSDGW